MTSASAPLSVKPRAGDPAEERRVGGRTVLRAVAAAIRTDPIVQLTLFAFAAFAVLYTAPFIAVEQRQSMMESSSLSLVFLAVLLVALRLGLRRVEDPAERRFWSDLSVAIGCWIGAVLFPLAPLPEVVLLIGEEALYAAYYVAFVLALERQPHLRPDERPKGALLGWPVFAIFVSGLFAYFSAIPFIVNRQEYDSLLPTTYLLLILDAFITAKVLDLCWRAEPLRWQVHYALLALTSALFFYNDLYNLPFYAAHTDRTWQLPEALLWNFQFVLLVLAARLRHQPFPTGAAAGKARRDAFAEVRESTLVVALLFPCVHFAAYTLDYLDQPSKPSRDLLMLAWLCVLGTVALLQHRRLEQRHSRLDISTATMSAEIAWREEMMRERERLIAELEAHNTELEARNAEMERFNYSLSHDLKSPLITIRGFLGLLRKEATSGDLGGLRRTLRRIRNAADHMGRLLEQVLELSRIGRIEGPPEEVAMLELAHQAASEVICRAATPGRPGGGKMIHLEIEVDPALPVVTGHRRRLAEALVELLDNAARFMGPQQSPRIKIGCRRDGNATVFEVRDNGIGIDQRYRDQIFGLFDRLDQGGEGTGIGLARVRRIVEMHGGRIWVESDGRQRGSIFCFTLAPREPPPPAELLGPTPPSHKTAVEKSDGLPAPSAAGGSEATD